MSSLVMSGINYRPPPETLAKTQQGQINSWCRYDPGTCVTQCGIETAFVALAYCAVLYLTGGDVPSVMRVLKFVPVFFVLMLAARLLSDDLGNKISITAVSGIGAKTVALLAPRFASW